MKIRLIVALAMALMLVATLALPAVAQWEGYKDASVAVNQTISITLTGDISFSNVTPPVFDNGAEGQSEGVPAITVTINSGTNVNIDVGIRGELTEGSLTIDNWKYSTTFSAIPKTSIPSTYTAVYTNIDPTVTSNVPFYHWITVPNGTDSGTHTVRIYYKVIETGNSF